MGNDVMAIRRRLMGMASGGIPPRYRRVNCLIREYASQYIDTNIPLQDKLAIVRMDYEITAIQQNVPAFGARAFASSGQKFGVWFNSSKKPALNYANLDSGYINIDSPGGRHVLSTTSAPNVKLLIDGDAIYEGSTSSAATDWYNANLLLFDMNNGSPASPIARAMTIKLYGICFRNDTKELFNGVPVVDRQNNAVGLYDFVSGNFFGKANENANEFRYE